MSLECLEYAPKMESGKNAYVRRPGRQLLVLRIKSTGFGNGSTKPQFSYESQ